jgi:hypothetical protein
LFNAHRQLLRTPILPDARISRPDLLRTHFAGAREILEPGETAIHRHGEQRDDGSMMGEPSDKAPVADPIAAVPILMMSALRRPAKGNASGSSIRHKGRGRRRAQREGPSPSPR